MVLQAKLAGLPEEVIDRANRIVAQLCENDIVDLAKNIAVEGQSTRSAKRQKPLDDVDMAQMSFLDTIKDDDIIEELRTLDISQMTPIEALNALNELQVKVRNRW